MLGRLLKYEIKATARLFLPLYLTILVFAIINRFIFPIYNVSDNAPTFSNIGVVISMIVYTSLMLGLVLMTVIVMIQRFYRSLLGDEGYLMFTLPVSSQQHIISKLAVSMLWTIASAVIALCSILIIASKHIFAPGILEELSIVISRFKAYLGAYTYLMTIEVILLGLTTLALTILTIYAAIALGHLFHKYKLLISFGMYILLKTFSEIFMMAYGFIFSHRLFLVNMPQDEIPSISQINSMMLSFLIGFGILTAGYFFLTNYILKRKLNLE